MRSATSRTSATVRAQDITDEVTKAVPELAESVPDLAGKLMAARSARTTGGNGLQSTRRSSFADVRRW